MEWAEPKVRKEDHVRPALQRALRQKRWGVYYILKSMEQGTTFRILEPKYPTADPNYQIIKKHRSRFTHYYFYLTDQALGPMVLRVGSFLPFTVTAYLNGHSFIDRRTINAFVNKEIANRIGALLGQMLVVLFSSDTVRVAFHFKLQAGMRQDNARNLGQLLTSAGPESVLPRVEKDIRHIDDETSSTVAGFQNQVQLLGQIVAQVGWNCFGSPSADTLRFNGPSILTDTVKPKPWAMRLARDRLSKGVADRYASLQRQNSFIRPLLYRRP
jgi:hypothetical protein